MLLILLSWIFIVAVLFPQGYLCLKWFTHISAFRKDYIHPSHFIISGFIITTCLATILNYFVPINQYVLLGITILSVLIYLKEWSGIRQYFSLQKEKLKEVSWLVIACFICILFISLIKSASPSEIYDEGGYFLPYIRWIEQFRITPGIANIEDRYGFNSSFHIISALFSFSWLKDGGLYDLNGLLLPVFGTFFLQRLTPVLKGQKSLTISGLCRIFCLIFLLRNMLTSPAADFSAMFLSEMICIMVLMRIEDGNWRQIDEEFFLLFIYMIFLVTLKLTALFIGLSWMLILDEARKSNHDLRWRQRFICAAIILLPWLGRSSVITGYLLYPMYQIDLLHVDWKVPEDIARKQYFYVSEFARTNASPDESEYLATHRTVVDWVPLWFQRENTFNKGIFILLLISLAISAMVFIRGKSLNLRKQSTRNRFIFLLILNIVIWFFKSPAFRFGWAAIIIFIGIIIYIVMSRIFSEKTITRFGIIVLILFITQNTYKSIAETLPILNTVLIQPASIKNEPFTTALVNSIPVNVSNSYSCWGINPPCLHKNDEQIIEFRGTTIEQGIRSRRSDSLKMHY
jgi:hypothetical protein